MSHYESYWRALDDDNVMHLATDTMELPNLLCDQKLQVGWAVTPPYALTRGHVRVCEICNERAGG